MRQRSSSTITEKEQAEENYDIHVLIKHKSKPEEQVLIKRGYILHIPYKRNRGEKEEDVKGETQPSLSHKKHSAKRWVVERTNSWHNRFRNYLPDMKRR